MLINIYILKIMLAKLKSRISYKTKTKKKKSAFLIYVRKQDSCFVYDG